MIFRFLQLPDKCRFNLACLLSLWGFLIVSEWVYCQETNLLPGDQQVIPGPKSAQPRSGPLRPTPRPVVPPSSSSEGGNPPPNPFQRQSEYSNAPIPPSPNPPIRQQPRTQATPTSNISRSTSQNNHPFSPRLARVPYIMGDFFGRGHTTVYLQGQDFSGPIGLPNPSAGDVVGRVRLQDNNSPLPRDRVFFDYSFFHNVPLTFAGMDVNRFSPGIEKTYFDGMASLEIRVPMAVTLNTNIVPDVPSESSTTEFGNVMIAPKFLLTATHEMALAAGLGVSLPTADDVEIGLGDGTQLLSVSNESVHLVPYMALLYAPKQNHYFAQAFLSYDFDTRGNSVHTYANGTIRERLGIWQDQNLASLSLSAGSWLYENHCCNNLLESISWSAEVHYTATVNHADSLTDGASTFGNREANLSLVNGAIGMHVNIGRTKFTVGYATPFTSSDRVFDGELRLFVNRFF